MVVKCIDFLGLLLQETPNMVAQNDKFILSWFWRSEVQSQGVSRWVHSGALREHLCPPLVPGGCQPHWVLLGSGFRGSQHHSLSAGCLLSVSVFPFLLLLRVLVIGFRAHLIQDDLILRSLPSLGP